jgi:D-alanyl-D-alanine carboxypeptidase/D-alanyl-D-alanine-endopeptidase (penicillin-binding protein 4)
MPGHRALPRLPAVPRLSRVCCLLLVALAYGLPPSAARAEPLLNAAVRGHIAAARLDRATVGASIVDVQTGEILCDVNADRRFVPASNVKLITTGVALLALGADFQFTTTLYARGTVAANGTLDGNLVLVAGGDPAISGRRHDGRTTAVFDALAATAARTVRLVRGDLVIDDTIFDRQYIHPSWPRDQLLRWYCAPVSAFALNDNCIDVAVKPGPVGEPARVLLDPPTDYFTVRNTCRTVAAGKARAIISRLPDRDTLAISGTLTPKSPGAASPVAVADPTRFAATVLRERLTRAGVRVAGALVLAEKPAPLKDMARLAEASHSLGDAVRTANKRSQNFYAEMILKTLGRRVAHPATWAAGRRVVSEHLKAVGIRPGTYTLDDGSGLSKRNAFSPLQFTVFLRHMARSRQAAPFLASLAVSGVDGTLRGRLDGPRHKRAVLAKTGTVRGASALSGYVKSGGRLRAFSILVNGDGLRAASARRLQDAICRTLVEAAR